MRKLFMSVLLIVVLLGSIACVGNTSTPELPLTGGLEDITWILESYGEPENLQTVLEGTEITALFDSAEGLVDGSGGCNGYTGEYMLSNNEISISEMFWTEIGCLEPQGILEQETQYLKTLQSAESYEISVGKLRITTSTKVLIFRGSEE